MRRLAAFLRLGLTNGKTKELQIDSNSRVRYSGEEDLKAICIHLADVSSLVLGEQV